MGQVEIFTLNKHTAGAAAGIIYGAIVGLQHFHQEFHDAGRGIELAAFFTFGNGKFSQAIFIDPAQQVAVFILGFARGNGTDEVNELSQVPGVQVGAGIVFGKYGKGEKLFFGCFGVFDFFY